MCNNFKLFSSAVLATLLLLSACSEPDKTKVIDEKTVIEAIKDPIDIDIHSLDELMAMFKEHQYDSENWLRGIEKYLA